MPKHKFIKYEFGRKEILSKYIYDKIYFNVAKQLTKTSITPNQVTATSMIVGFLAAILFALGEYQYIFLAAILIQINVILDGADGDLARLKKTVTKYGHWLDTCADMMVTPFLILGISFGVFFQTYNAFALMLGAFAITTHLLITVIAQVSRRFYTKLPIKKTILGKLRKYGLDVDFLLFSKTLIYLAITVMALLNQLFLFLFLWTIYVTVGMIAEFFIFRKQFAKK